jgi:hypothetical protein
MGCQADGDYATIGTSRTTGCAQARARSAQGKSFNGAIAAADVACRGHMRGIFDVKSFRCRRHQKPAVGQMLGDARPWRRHGSKSDGNKCWQELGQRARCRDFIRKAQKRARAASVVSPRWSALNRRQSVLVIPPLGPNKDKALPTKLASHLLFSGFPQYARNQFALVHGQREAAML